MRPCVPAFMELDRCDIGGREFGDSLLGRECGSRRDHARAALKRAGTKPETPSATFGKI